jgi:hypothetical protein
VSSDNFYWSSGLGSANFVSDLPAQAIPNSKKSERWQKANLDALERIGIKQFNENKRLVDFYRMTQGKVSFSELSELMPQLREVEQLMDDFKIPTTIKHYDVLGQVLNYLEAVVLGNKDKFHPTNIDEIASNERMRIQTEMLQQYIAAEWEKELRLKMINAGIDLERTEFESEEEKQAYIQEIEQQKQALTPPEINAYLQKEWKPVAVEWCRMTLEADEIRFRINEIDRECISDLLRTGRCFQHYFVKHDSYGVERWHPVNTFFSQTIDAKYTQYGEYAGRIHFYTPSDFVNAKGHHMSMKQKKDLLNKEKLDNQYLESGYSLNGAMQQGFAQTTLVPHRNYHEYNLLLDIQDYLGVPLASRTIYKKDGTTEQFNDFLPKQMNTFDNNVSRYASYLREDLNLRTDMIMVTEAYWRSFKLVGYLTYEDENGLLATELVTEDILKSFIADMGIKELKNISIEEYERTKEANTIMWDYIPEIWQGEKALTANTLLKEDLYFNIRPLPYQIKGDSNIYDVQLPIAGLVADNPSEKVINWQNLYNIAMNQMYNLMEKEIGAFFIFDLNFLPSDIKEFGDTETSLYNMLNIVKTTGLWGVDGSTKNIQQSTAFNQFTMQDASLHNQIVSKQNQAEFFKFKIYETFGLNPQAMGEPVKYQTAEGVKQNMDVTNAQTDYLYDLFNGFKSRSLEMHLAVAQYAQGEGVDISVEYVKSDLSRAFLRFTDKDFPMRRFGIMAVSDSKKRKELEAMKQYMLNQNTIGADELTLSSIIASDSMVSLIEIARLERQRREEMERMASEREGALLERQAEIEKEKEITTHLLNEESKDKDRAHEISLKRLDALGRAADNNAEAFAYDMINKAADLELKREKADDDKEFKLLNLETQIQSKKEEYKLKADKLKLDAEKLQLERERLATEKYIAQINKN